MKKIFKISAYSLLIILIASTTFAQENNPSLVEHIADTHLFHKTAIINVEDFRILKNKPDMLIAKKIIVQSVSYKVNPTKNKMLYAINLKIINFEQPIWTISAKELPITNTDCQEMDSLLCNEYPPNDPNQAACHSPCIVYGPEFLAFNEKTGKLYIATQTESGGNSSWPLLTFIADINTKEIKPFKIIDGPINSSLSPSGNNLVLCGTNSITVIDTHTDENFVIHENNSYTPRMRLHILSQIHWLNDSQFSYLDNGYRSKFQESPDIVTKKIFDIRIKKIILSKKTSGKHDEKFN